MIESVHTTQHNVYVDKYTVIIFSMAPLHFRNFLLVYISFTLDCLTNSSAIKISVDIKH